MTAAPGKIFSFAEANGLVPIVVELTEDVVERLDAIRRLHEMDPGKARPAMPETVVKEVEQTLSGWSEKIQQLGAHPKGYFTVDFQSPDPELLYCWTYGEHRIGYAHKVWENFTHRRPLAGETADVTEHPKWIH